MNYYKVRKSIIYIIINLVLLIMISIVYGHAEKAASMYRIGMVYLYALSINLLLFLFGLLIEYEKILVAFKNGFNINKILLSVAVVMLIISCLPVGFAIPINLRVGLFLSNRVIRYVLNIWSGILVARSFVIKTSN